MNSLVSFVFCCAFSAISLSESKVFHYQPEQIHLSFGESVTDMVVTWSTGDNTNESIVKWGIGDLVFQSKGDSKQFVDGGRKKRSQYIHTVRLKGLFPNTKYIYRCGSSLGWSSEFWFKSPPDDTNWSPRLAIFGDMGSENAQSLTRLQEDTRRGMYDAILHVGDFAYDMNSHNGKVGDKFMNQIQSIAGYVPYMVCPGNHEEAYNFSNYRARFNMPGNTENIMYSFNLGPVHFIGFSTEVYYFLDYGIKPLINQYYWLENDLKEASKPENRKQHPWIITFGHRPMYCSNQINKDCKNYETIVRVGLPMFHYFGLEDLFYKYGVDVEIWAHEHSYERLWPIYNYTVYNGSYAEPYRNPGAPVHITTGSAGCKEGEQPFRKHIPPWSAFHSTGSKLKTYHFVESVTEIIVTWSTRDKTKESIVEYGIGGLILQEKGHSKLFVDGGKKQHSQYIHTVRLKDLQPNTKYTYHCGSSLGWSPEFWFKTPPDDTNWSPSLAIFGDMGNENAQSLARLQEDTQRGMYDAMLHVGDFAYDMDSQNAKVGDEFMNQLQSVAGYIPYMVCAGNHEEAYNFSNYRARFNMPGNTESIMYSFNLGPVHFIGLSTEVYYFLNYGIKPLVNQYNWLENDLKEATKPENRKVRPWIVTFGHRPMYCSNEGDNDCTHNETLIRVGLPFLHVFGLEDLFYKYGVDVEIWAHEHSYERLWPIYNYTIYNGSHSEPYTNPGAPVHIVTGSAGCKEGRTPFIKNPAEWSAFQSADYGYTRMKAYNTTHLYFEQVSDDKEGAIVDSFWIIKHQHGAYRKNTEVL